MEKTSIERKIIRKVMDLYDEDSAPINTATARDQSHIRGACIPEENLITRPTRRGSSFVFMDVIGSLRCVWSQASRSVCMLLRFIGSFTNNYPLTTDRSVPALITSASCADGNAAL